jgi:hypothetical protein
MLKSNAFLSADTSRWWRKSSALLCAESRWRWPEYATLLFPRILPREFSARRTRLMRRLTLSCARKRLDAAVANRVEVEASGIQPELLQQKFGALPQAGERAAVRDAEHVLEKFRVGLEGAADQGKARLEVAAGADQLGDRGTQVGERNRNGS